MKCVNMLCVIISILILCFPQKVSAAVSSDGAYMVEDNAIQVGEDTLGKEEVNNYFDFGDVSTDSRFYKNIFWAAEKSIFKGTGHNTFCPEDNITRADFITGLYRYGGCAPETIYEGFEDVPKVEYYSTAVTWAVGSGIIQGTDSTHFSPNMELTREQAAVIMLRYFNAKGYTQHGASGGYVFKDEDKISIFAKEAVQWAQTSGIYVISTAAFLEPQRNVSRAEAAAILHRFDHNFLNGIFMDYKDRGTVNGRQQDKGTVNVYPLQE